MYDKNNFDHKNFENVQQLNNSIINEVSSSDFIDQIGDIDYPLNPSFNEEINQDLHDDLPKKSFIPNNNNTSKVTQQKKKSLPKKRKPQSTGKKKELDSNNKLNQKHHCPLVDHDNCTNNKQRGYGRPNMLYDHLLRDHITCPWSEQCGMTEQFKSRKELHKHIGSYEHPRESNYCETCDYLSIDKSGNFRRHQESIACISRHES
jgi:hypothetical protein